MLNSASVCGKDDGERIGGHRPALVDRVTGEPDHSRIDPDQRTVRAVPAFPIVGAVRYGAEMRIADITKRLCFRNQPCSSAHAVDPITAARPPRGTASPVP